MNESAYIDSLLFELADLAKDEWERQDLKRTTLEAELVAVNKAHVEEVARALNLEDELIQLTEDNTALNELLNDLKLELTHRAAGELRAQDALEQLKHKCFKDHVPLTTTSAILNDLTRSDATIERLRKYIDDSENSGHRSYCAAIRGPERESWLEPERCDCELKTLPGFGRPSKISLDENK